MLRSWLRTSACALLLAGGCLSATAGAVVAQVPSQVDPGVILREELPDPDYELLPGPVIREQAPQEAPEGAEAVTFDLTAVAVEGVNPLLTGTINGFKLGQDASVLTSQPVYMTDAGLESPDGRYAITASGAAADNYVFAYETGTLTVGDPVDIPTGDGGANAISLLLEALKVCGSGVGPLDEVLCNPVFEQAPPPLVLGLVDPTGQAQ